MGHAYDPELMPSAITPAIPPGIADDIKSTGARIAIGIATNPADDLITEFLPDIAKHIHVRIVFVQEILQQVANRPNTQ